MPFGPFIFSFEEMVDFSRNESPPEGEMVYMKMCGGGDPLSKYATKTPAVSP